MLWIPITAAGIVNGIGHWWGYRNFEAPDASRNFSPWGILIGGEELHNNHHTYPASAKLSVKPYEFDIGWAYIRLLELLHLATREQDRAAPALRSAAGLCGCNDARCSRQSSLRADGEVRAPRARRHRCRTAQPCCQRRRRWPPFDHATCQALAAPRCGQDSTACESARCPGPLGQPEADRSWSRCAKSCAACGLRRMSRQDSSSRICSPGSTRPNRAESRRFRSLRCV